jgi:hypothetical protein
LSYFSRDCRRKLLLWISPAVTLAGKHGAFTYCAHSTVLCVVLCFLFCCPAAVTFVALGNGAPDLSANIAAISAGEVTLSAGALTGAAMFVQVRSTHKHWPTGTNYSFS